MTRIVLDGLPLQVRSAGVAVYTEQLVRAAATLRPMDEFVLYGLGGPAFWALRQAGNGPSPGRGAPLPANVSWLTSALYPLVMGYPLPYLPRLFALPSQRLPGAALFHATNYAAPRTVLPVVVTIHDLALLRFPSLGTPAIRRIVERTRAVAGAARHVIADSESTARDIRELLGVATARLRVVYPGCHPECRPVPAADAHRAVADRYGIEPPYVLHLGTLEPRKNLPRLLEAFARARDAHHLPHRLVLAGADGWGAADVTRTIQQRALEAVVRRLGPVSSADLPALYAGADLFVYPSLYEGFGLPVLEALACGTPVITSTVSSLPEVAGDAAVLVDPHDIAALANAIGQVLGDAALRADLRGRGPARAARFTWERCARETLAVYDEALTER